ncbi:MAG: hypothetical protein JWQ72_415 [Polaromonas sp.]|nr:hypothetical protein [Polaromonas sp.]
MVCAWLALQLPVAQVPDWLGAMLPLTLKFWGLALPVPEAALSASE